jgi:TRAP transporter TAXI family solute receptor
VGGSNRNGGPNVVGHRVFAVYAVLVAAYAAWLAWDRWFRPVWPDELIISTATVGGTYDVAGDRFAERLGALPGDRQIIAEAKASDGSGHNLQRLRGASDTEAHLALVSGVTLQGDDGGGVRVLSYLYDDVVQLVVSPDCSATTVAELAGKRVYGHRAGSATRMIASAIMQASCPGTGLVDGTWSYEETARELIDGTIKAAFFCAGTPTTAVRDALAGRCRLISLDDDAIAAVQALDPAGSEEKLQAEFYLQQEEEVNTVKVPVYLVCRARLADELVERILDAMFDNLAEMLAEHLATADRIRIQDAFSRRPEHVAWHPGAMSFRRREAGKLWIVTGVVGGAYHRVGREIAEALEQQGIESRVIHTHGSLQNAELLLEEDRPILAIMQYDTALAVLDGSPRRVYGMDESDGVPYPRVADLRRVVTLHEERLLIVARRNEAMSRVEPDEEPPDLFDLLTDMTLGLPPVDSGTAQLAMAVLECYGIPRARVVREPIDVLVRQLEGEQIDAAMFVSGAPGGLIDGLLEPGKLAEPTFVMLPVEEEKVRDLTRGSVLGFASRDGVDTLTTRAVLVAREGMDDVAEITRAIIWGGAFLSTVPDPRETLPKPLASLKLHPDAKAAYYELDLMAPPSSMSFLELTAHVLAIAVIVVGVARGTRTLWRERMSNTIKDRILSIPVEAEMAFGVQRLGTIRADVRRRAGLEWWRPARLDRARWHDLEEMIENRVGEARTNHTRSMLARARQAIASPEGLTPEAALALRRQAWCLAEAGELDTEQLDLVLRALDDAGEPGDA